MVSHPIFKSIDSFTNQTFKAYKTWTLTESTIGQYSSSVNEAIYVSSSLVADTLGSNASGLRKRSLFASIYSAYYAHPKEPFFAQGGNSPRQDRDLSHRAVVVSIGNAYTGEQIKPLSITITDNSTGSIIIKDDGVGNLYDSTDTTNYIPSGGLVGYWNFDDGFITSGNLASLFVNRNHVVYQNPAWSRNVTYTDGIFGSRINFTGTTGSFAVVNDYRDINFRTNEDFALSVRVWIPTAQVGTPVVDNSIIEKWDCNGGYPFILRVFNSTHTASSDVGKIYCATWDGESGIGITSSAALNDNLPHHILYQRHGDIYELYVDGTLNGTGPANLGQTHNHSKLYLGARGWHQAVSGTIYNFTGAIDDLRIYSGSLTTAQISTLHTKPANTNVLGQVFYSHGILVLTNLSGSYSNLMLSGSEFVMVYKSTVSITENTAVATVLPSEFEMTLNPSAATVHDEKNMEYLSLVTGSDWSPYITTMGLYDNDYNLVAIAKFTKPIKKPTDIPLTFVVRWDS